MSEFKKQEMVNWFAPGSLLKIGLETVLSSLFGRYADRREIQAALTKDTKVFSYGEQDAIWFDYVADLGDGFNPTYTVATALAQDKLNIDHLDLPRGRFLIMGGDQVYPSASLENYHNRLKGPYSHALPKPDTASDSDPHLYVLPGNHDWYDGLTAFLRQFVQRRYIGGWRTQQQRSYFAIALPHNWWLLAIDIQLNADLDSPQKDYFKDCIAQFKPGDKVMIVSAEPTWIEEGLSGKAVAPSLQYIEQQVDKSGAEVLINLAGDFHYYAHYQSEKRHRITCGGGGAFMHGTHHLTEDLPVKESGREVNYTLNDNVFPSKSDSLKTLCGNLLFPIRNKAMAATLGVFYTLLVLTFQQYGIEHQYDWFANLSNRAIELTPLLQNMPTLFLALVMLVAMIAFYDPLPSQSPIKGRLERFFIGGGHGLLHSALAIYLAHLIIPLIYQASWPSAVLTVLVYWFFASLAGGFLFGLYLLLSNLFLKLMVMRLCPVIVSKTIRAFYVFI